MRRKTRRRTSGSKALRSASTMPLSWRSSSPHWLPRRRDPGDHASMDRRVPSRSQGRRGAIHSSSRFRHSSKLGSPQSPPLPVPLTPPTSICTGSSRTFPRLQRTTCATSCCGRRRHSGAEADCFDCIQGRNREPVPAQQSDQAELRLSTVRLHRTAPTSASAPTTGPMSPRSRAGTVSGEPVAGIAAMSLSDNTGKDDQLIPSDATQTIDGTAADDDPFDYQTTVNALTLQLLDEHERRGERTSMAAHACTARVRARSSPWTTEPSLLCSRRSPIHPTSDPMRSPSPCADQLGIEDSYFHAFMANLLSLFSTDRRLLETRGSLIIRQLCASLHTSAFSARSPRILEKDEDLEFASIMVQTSPSSSSPRPSSPTSARSCAISIRARASNSSPRSTGAGVTTPSPPSACVSLPRRMNMPATC